MNVDTEEQKSSIKERIIEEENEYLLEIKNLTKKFTATVALNNLSMKIKKGEIHALLGENGAGKSTLCNVITGILPYHDYKGDLYFKGKKLQYTHPSQALKAGIAMVYQQRNLISTLTSAQNIFLGAEPGRGGVVNDLEVKKSAQKLIDKYQVDLPLNTPIFRLNPSKRQLTEIMRALRTEIELLILDEPTSSLLEADVEDFLRIIKNIKKEGITIIFISHKLDEIFTSADTITILRDGQHVITEKTSNLTNQECRKYMVDRELKDMYPPKKSISKEKLLEVKGLKDKTGFVHDVSFEVQSGEIVGLYGLAGSGYTEICELIAGVLPYAKDKEQRGKVIFEGEDVTGSSIDEMMKKKIFYIPDDRDKKGLFHNMNIRENTTILYINNLMKGLGVVSGENKFALEVLNSKYLDIVYVSPEQSINDLSGGNKQKVVMSRWINETNINNIKLLIVNNVTEGVDVGVKYELYRLLRNLVEDEKKKMAILFISTEMQEEMGLCDRVYCVKNGTITTEVKEKNFEGGKAILDHIL